MSNTDSTTPAVDTEAANATTTDVEKKLRLVIQRHPNPDATSYHVNRRLTEKSGSYRLVSKEGVPVERYSFDSPELEPFVQLLAEKLIAVPGILAGSSPDNVIRVSTYELAIKKGKAFTDEDIESAVIAIIAESFDLTVEEIDQTVESERHPLAFYQRNYEPLPAEILRISAGSPSFLGAEYLTREEEDGEEY